MKVTRQHVFETNSSSTHSITIAPKTDKPYRLDTIPLSKDGVCRIYTGEFGWEVRAYRDAATKASYALTWVKAFPDRNAQLDLLRTVVVSALGTPVEFIESQDDTYPWGYIDHQSEDVCAEAFESRKSLHSFIFNPGSELRTNNDNH